MEKLSKNLTVKYTLLLCAFWVSQCTIFSFTAVYLHAKSFNNTQIGIVLSLGAIFSIILQPLIGGFADKAKKISLRYISITLMLIVFVFAVILFLLPDTFLLIGGIYIIILSIQLTLASLMNSLALEYVNMGIPVNYGLARGISSVAYAIISLSLGIATAHFSGSIILIVFIVSYLAVIIFTWNFTIEIPESLKLSARTNHKTSGSESLDMPDKQVLLKPDAPAGIFQFFIKYKKFTLYLIGVTMIFYSHNLINSYMINIMENVGGNSSDMGTSLAIAATLELPVMAAFVFLIRKIKCSSLLKFSALFFVIKSAVTWLAPSVGTVLFSQVLQMFAFAIFTPASIYYVNEIVDAKDRVKGQTMLGVANLSLVGAIGGITGGKILDSLGVSDMLLLGTVVTGLGFLVLCYSTESTPLEMER